MEKYQQNKYLADLGLDITKYGTNFVDASIDEREENWKKQRKDYGFDEREVWNLDIIFIQWLYSHLMMYKEKASQIIDLSYYANYKWGERKITLEKAIDKVLAATKAILVAEDFDEKERKYQYFCKNIMPLLAEILPALWY